MSDFADAFDAPVIFREGGLDLRLPRLDIDDVAAWIEELAPSVRAAKMAEISPKTPFAERKQLEWEARQKPSLGFIADFIYEPAGMKSAVDKALAKSGVAGADERLRIIRRIKSGRLLKLAMDVSGLFDRDQLDPQPADKPKGGADPLAEGGGDTSTPMADGATPEPSSSNTPEAAPSAA